MEQCGGLQVFFFNCKSTLEVYQAFWLPICKKCDIQIHLEIILQISTLPYATLRLFQTLQNWLVFLTFWIISKQYWCNSWDSNLSTPFKAKSIYLPCFFLCWTNSREVLQLLLVGLQLGHNLSLANSLLAPPMHVTQWQPHCRAWPEATQFTKCKKGHI